MSEVKVGDLIRITEDQNAAPVGAVVPVTSTDPRGEWVTYRWRSSDTAEPFDNWYSDTGSYELLPDSLIEELPDGVSPEPIEAKLLLPVNPPKYETTLDVDWRDNVVPQPEWEKKSPGDDPVNHPSHYTFGKYEVLDVIEDWGLSYHLGNATKYIARAGRKDPAKEKQDLEKAVFYIQRRIANLG
jgi:hypothetical protein